ncbi:unnamed protein product [Pieris macdunnoughi]|uniref:AB hydrolase-1 domain-containing protein n=1 Tax=Pieris macdunnoughi TaxID=345717 RepID=A0A821S942_9NEOP|nr:unnamed protein product [Pieris macdunnoughi]
MGVITYIKRLAIANALTLYYTAAIIFYMLVTYLKNPFRNPWANKQRLVPPARLSDPKYGVHKYIKVNNVKLHYVENGDPSKPLMVFLHGFPEFWYSWRYQLLEFKKDYWCIAVDMRGYGDSERPEGVSFYNIQTMAEDIRDLLRQLGREKFILVSHDWGGIIATRFRDNYPETLQALIVLSSTAHEAWLDAIWNDDEQRKLSWYVFLYRMRVIPELMIQMNNLELLHKVMIVEGKPSVDKEDLECYKYWFGKQYALTPPINYYRAAFDYIDVELKRHDENVPFLFAHGTNEIYLGKKIMETMKKLYKTIETTKVQDSGHFMQQEDPEKVNRLIRTFLQKQNL